MIKKSTTSEEHHWSAKVTRESDALDLEAGVFSFKDPKKIARSLKRSADSSMRRKSEPFRSAMSMLVFYINRAGVNLDEEASNLLRFQQSYSASAKVIGVADEVFNTLLQSV